MLKIFGLVLHADLEGTVDPNCVQTCFEASDCILAYFDTSGRCQLFNFNETETLEVEETTKADELFVAFKTTLPSNTCPAYDRILPVVNIREDPVSWKKSGTTFSFQKCIGDWKMFRRSNPEITVCMKPFDFAPRILRKDAVTVCENMGAKLTGVVSAVESRWILGSTELENILIFQYFPEKINDLHEGGIGVYDGYWIDGIRNCEVPGTNCTTFRWTDNYTVGNDALDAVNAALSFSSYLGDYNEDCLAVEATPIETQTINDVGCIGTADEYGMVCGYRMV
ncbi:hypothetical protein CRE_18165 [Caenorhabditis remanei]|uniref:PAN-3 domain-containing protein n=1 Tax=Caenorhabditis remanei TaxID=31234 RepID=E3N8K8_CAERE|nr:hypothetical protein CRE_18165 [Caenorhabditis remanei]